MNKRMNTLQDSRSPQPEVLPRIVRQHEFESHSLHGNGAIRRAIYPDTVGSKQLFVGLAEFGPQTAPHVWHRHAVEVVGDKRLRYAEDFEEFYFVVDGHGSMQWRFDDGREVHQPIEAGDCVYMAPGVVEHRVFNEGTRMMRVLYGGTPPARNRSPAACARPRSALTAFTT